MKTYFATPYREKKNIINGQVQLVAEHDLIKSLMKVVNGLFAVLNDKRQFVAINTNLFNHLGINNSADLFGMRLGETLNCKYSDMMEGGCGTSAYCSTCGAAIAMVSALKNKTSAQQTCSIRTKGNGMSKNIFFNVKSTYFQINGKDFILIFLEDITYEQKMNELEQVFFHDIYNKLSGIINGCEILKYQSTENEEIIQIIYDLSYQMVREIEFQKKLIRENYESFSSEIEIIHLPTIYKELDRVFTNHSATKDKIIIYPPKIEPLKFYSDIAIIIRVVTNMIKNALEASPKGGRVRVYHLINDEFITFEVWNEGYIQEPIAKQIFNRNFTTKQGPGHGFGTFSMKLLGEEMLGGKVDFTTSEEGGTTFSFQIPFEKVA